MFIRTTDCIRHCMHLWIKWFLQTLYELYFPFIIVCISIWHLCCLGSYECIQIHSYYCVHTLRLVLLTTGDVFEKMTILVFCSRLSIFIWSFRIMWH